MVGSGTRHSVCITCGTAKAGRGRYTCDACYAEKRRKTHGMTLDEIERHLAKSDALAWGMVPPWERNG